MGSGFHWKLDINRINFGLINVEEYSFECFTKSMTYNVGQFVNNNFAIDKTTIHYSNSAIRNCSSFLPYFFLTSK